MVPCSDMVKERRKPFHTFANAMLAVALIGSAALPIVNYRATKNIIAAEMGIPLDCPKPPEAVNGIYPFDAIAVLGAGMALQKDTNQYGPNTFEKDRLTAAALLYLAGYTDTIVLHVGKQKPGVDPLLELQYLKEKVWDLSHQTVALPDTAVIMDTESVNTASSLQISAEQTKQFGWGSVLYVSDDFHLAKRVPVLACEFGIAGSFLSVEDIYAMYLPDEFVKIKKRNKSEGMAWRKFMEEIKLWSMIIDPKQRLQIRYKDWKFEK